MRKILTFVLLATALVACSTTPSGPAFTPHGPVGNDQALFYIYRPEVLKDRRALYELLVDDELVADMMNGGYITYLAKPGKIEISTRMKSTMMTSMEAFLTAEHVAGMVAEAGHTYYMRINYVAEKHIVPVQEAEALPEISELRLNPVLKKASTAAK